MKLFEYRLKDDVLTLFNENKETLCDIQNITSKDDLKFLIEGTLYNMNVINDVEEIEVREV